MKKIVVIAATALVLAGCSKGTQTQSSSPVAGAQDIAITTAFRPDPPQKGPETLTVSLKDGTGAPVKGASVKIETMMPSMAMRGPSVAAQGNGNGTYSAHLTLQYATKWEFSISAKASGKSGSAQVTVDVK